MQTNDRGQRLVSDLQGISDFATPPVTRNDRALAERLGLFNADWYCAEYPDVAACGADPFAHYMQSGWREGRKPAPGFSAEDYAQLEQGFNPHECNPIVHLLQVGLGNPAVCRWLDDTARPAFMEHPASLRLHDGLCLIGYLRSEIGLGQAARNLAYACDARRLPMSFRHLPLPGREGVAEFMTKCITVPDRKANLLVVGLPSICDLTHEIGPGRVNILYPFWELSQIPRAWLDVARRFDEIWAPTSFVAHAFPPDFDRPMLARPRSCGCIPTSTSIPTGPARISPRRYAPSRPRFRSVSAMSNWWLKHAASRIRGCANGLPQQLRPIRASRSSTGHSTAIKWMQ